MPILTEIKKTFGVKRLIVVADKALNSGDNIAYHIILGDGYIYSKSIRGASEEFKNWVLDKDEYRQLSDRYKLKSQLVPDAVVNVTVGQKGKRKIKKAVRLAQKWIVFYSEKYAVRAKYKREETITKALEMIRNPMKYRRTFDYGAASYIQNLKINKETGEILNIEDTLILDTQKIEEEEKFDGYYAIVTSELDEADEHTVEMYRGLWHIEESFKVTKSVLESRPVYLSTYEHINAHFLICFISLLIGRIVEMRLEGKYTIARITETLRKVACSHLYQNVWLFDYADEVTDLMNDVFGTEIGKKLLTLQKIKASLGQAKKAI
jgi:transposase